MNKILMVSSDTEFISGCSEFLSGHGFIVDGEDCPYKATKRIAFDFFDVLILDTYIDNMPPCHLVKIAKEIDPFSKVFIVSDSSDDMEELEYLKIGIDEYFRKSSPRELCLERLKKSIGFSENSSFRKIN